MTGRLLLLEPEETMKRSNGMPASVHKVAHRWRYHQQRQPAHGGSRGLDARRAGKGVGGSVATVVAAAAVGSTTMTERNEAMRRGDFLFESAESLVKDLLNKNQRVEEKACKMCSTSSSRGEKIAENNFIGKSFQEEKDYQQQRKPVAANYDHQQVVNRQAAHKGERLINQRRLLDNGMVHERPYQEPFQALARTTMGAIKQTLPWLPKQTRARLSCGFQANAGTQVRRTDLEGAPTCCVRIDGSCTTTSVCHEENGSQKGTGKKAIATYFKQNLYPKNLSWQTNVVLEPRDEDDEDSDELPEDACGFGCKYLQLEEESLKKANYASHLHTCTAAAVTPNLINLVEKESQQKRNKKKPVDLPPPTYSEKQSVGDILGQVSLSSLSNPFDVSSHLQSMRPPGTYEHEKRKQQTHHQHLHLSVDSIRLLLEHNLIATLIGAYILLSLAVIVVLILPYLFNFSLSPALKLDSSASYSTQEIQQPQQYQDKLHDNQAKEIPRLSSREQLSNNENLQLSSTESNRPSESTGQSSRSSDSELYWSDFKEHLDTSRSSSSTSKSSNLSEATDIPVAYPTEEGSSNIPLFVNQDGKKRPSQATNGSFKGSARFFDRWSVVHNQPCQPLRVPFCSRFFESMFADAKEASGPLLSVRDQQRAATLSAKTPPTGYDKTLLPNQFTLARQSQIERFMQKYEPIVDIKCYPLMPLFLCSIYAPKCVQTTSLTNSPVATSDRHHHHHQQQQHHHHEDYEQTLAAASFTGFFEKSPQRPHLAPVNGSSSVNSKSWSRLIPPCKSLCKVLLIKLIEPKECDFLPESDDPNICIGRQEHDWLREKSEFQHCQEDRFRCTTTGECIPKKWRCDGYGDCVDKSDELKCSKCNAVTQFYCGLDKCINKEQVCNGIRECSDGRDERQCLRLKPIVGLQNTTSVRSTTLPGRLEVWSALKDSWRPVCGANWSPMPMSHEACRALGYSRASETLILYGLNPSAYNQQNTNHSSSLSSYYLTSEPTNGSIAVKSLVKARAFHFHSLTKDTKLGNVSWISDDELQNASAQIKEKIVDVINDDHHDLSALDTSKNHSLRKYKEDKIGMRSLGEGSPSSWFDVASAAESVVISPDSTDTSEQLAGIIEDVVESWGKLNRVEWADHLVSYKRELAGSASSSSSQIVTMSVPTRASTDVKLKSIVAMLYRGAEIGCTSSDPDSINPTVHIRCQNFQCGRSVTSYQSRMKEQQIQTTSSARLRRKEMNSASRSALSQSVNQEKEDDIDDDDDDSEKLPILPVIPTFPYSNTSKVRRENRTHEAEEDFDFDLIDNSDKYYDESNEDEAIHSEMDTVKSVSSTGIHNLSSDSTSLGDNSDDKKLLVDQLSAEQVDKDQVYNNNNQQAVSARLVVGGIESMPGEFPYLAALHGGPDEVFFCGGVLISLNWLLTAAHCVGNRTQPDGWMVKVGVTRRIASPAFVKKLAVKKIIKHPAFNHGQQFNNDIALILLEESVEFNQYLRPICLPRANLKLGPNNSKDCVVVGFGKSKFSQEANYLHVAHFVNVPIVQHSVCSNWYSEQGVNITEGMLCAGYAEGKRDACQGDSGSGLFCRYSYTNQFFVAGVVSFGIRCATPKLPGVYTSVPLYVDWIKTTTRQYGYLID